MQKIFTPLFIFIIYISAASNSFAQTVPTSQVNALIDLYNNTGGASWVNKSNWLVGDPGSNNWYGVIVSGGNVVGISLPTNSLAGSIPASLGNLSQLSSLVLSNNNLTDTIPKSLGNLSQLSYLDLSLNNLSGIIPYSLGNTNLNTLYLNNNQLTGLIPGTLGNLTSMSDLELNNNNLSGSIPDSLRALSFLVTLDLSTNQLSGNIPAFLGRLPSLNLLNLYTNQLSGSIPDSLAISPSIIVLNLMSNQLSGSIPDSLGSASYPIQGINLSHNELTDTIPRALGEKPSLFLMDISYNQLTGTIPSTFTNITSGNATVAINNNKLTFDGLEYIVQYPGFSAPNLADSSQGIIPLDLNGSKLSMYAGGTLAKDTFYWYKNGVLNNTIIGDSTYTPVSSGNYSVIVSNAIASQITGLRLMSDTFVDIILPVTFLNFTGHLENYTSQLQWQTTAEVNTAYYNVQRSTDDINFTTIGTVNANGNSSGNQNYNYTDNLSALIGQPKNLYYRLQEVDKTGQDMFSNIVNLPLGATTSSISIYPNPASAVLNIDIANNQQPVFITISDANGIKQLEQTQSGSHISINISNLAAGVYFIQVNDNESVLQQKFIKQ